ncbi:MAG: type II toxin-antitoxin system RelE/ParE family toxin [Saprospiraceae bacterium]|nr:type II toxin-antitoxin system RelE/ParE family toxin [Saprospiraceae bacterium]
MNYKVISLFAFEKQLKRLCRKYPSLKIEFANILEQLSSNPEFGTPLGQNCFKIRISVSSKGKGKRSGARIIFHTITKEETVYLLSIFDKSEKTNITDKELSELLKMIH